MTPPGTRPRPSTRSSVRAEFRSRIRRASSNAPLIDWTGVRRDVLQRPDLAERSQDSQPLAVAAEHHLVDLALQGRATPYPRRCGGMPGRVSVACGGGGTDPCSGQRPFASNDRPAIARTAGRRLGRTDQPAATGRSSSAATTITRRFVKGRAIRGTRAKNPRGPRAMTLKDRASLRGEQTRYRTSAGPDLCYLRCANHLRLRSSSNGVSLR